MAATPRLPADADVSQSVGQTSMNQLGLEDRRFAGQDQSRLGTDGCDRPQLWGHSLQPGVCTEGPSLSLLLCDSERFFKQTPLELACL